MKVIEAKDLVKEFGDLKAVDEVSFSVEQGEVFGFLGPNGAGKTTTINMLCTLLRPTSGTAILGGHDVLKEPDAVRQSIGLVFQDPSLDERLTAYENLQFHGLIYNIPRASGEKRIAEVLDLVDLSDRKNALVRTFSGGMRRRLEIARGLLHRPHVLFLDEPTLGLDPQTRNHIWEYVRELRKKKDITIFLTTHYMDEAENCDRIAIIDYGKIVALDTPSGLKKQVGGDVIILKTADNKKAQQVIETTFNLEVKDDGAELLFEVSGGEEFVPKLIAALPVEVTSVSVRRPTLDDVFLKLTGRHIREETVDATGRMRQHVRAGGRH